jgi:hypothetical protein
MGDAGNLDANDKLVVDTSLFEAGLSHISFRASRE